MAGPLDLAVMKLAAIARRGLRRDFWDLYVVVKSGIALPDIGLAYVCRFGVAESDLYHVLRALTYFEDAERDSALPTGMTAQLWAELKRFFLVEAPKLVSLKTV
ncbi:MAG: nucleotidyl transferase AbiEii/AbiGii toxin family protein [Myxococcaceae bacterium]